tara:strand:+ start:2057 stop:2479 length:423 start_codon:yes stop_codon:yes gene_type:complete
MSKLDSVTELTRDKKIFYRDFFTDFSRHAQTGELNTKTNEESVKQSVKNLLLTNKYERLFYPELGANLRALLFENATPAVYQQTKDYIQDVFDNYEPRAEFITSDVSFDHDRNRADITVRFRLINSVEPTTLSVILERTR